MEPCLDAACKLTVVERRQGRSSNIQASTKEVIGHLRPDAFASPGSLLGLQGVFVVCWLMNNEDYRSAFTFSLAIFTMAGSRERNITMAITT